MKNYNALFVISVELYILKKDSFFPLFAVSARIKMKKYLKKKNQLRY